MPKKPSNPIPIATVKHKDKRTNIPTKELRGFVADDEAKPKSILYPRDPSLDPQLVWKGKDAQDAQPLSVPAVPIYIQEKIHPQAIIEDLRSGEWSVVSGEKGSSPQATRRSQLNLFADFNNIKFEDLIDFYRHEQNWSNRFILGDSLLVMTSLAEKEGLKGKVQCLYFDPPYGINFGSNWQVSTRKRDVKDGKAEDATRQPEQIRAFRDTWKLGIHSYLAYLRDRLTAARELLTESGSVFVQIGDENVHLVRSLLDEVFGSENFMSQIPFIKTSGKGGKYLDTINDTLLWYTKDKEHAKYKQLYQPRSQETMESAYNWIELPDGAWRKLNTAELDGDQPIPKGKRFVSGAMISQSGGEKSSFPVELDGKKFLPSTGTFWKTNQGGMEMLKRAGRLLAVGNTLVYKRYAEDFPVVALTNWWDDTKESTFASDKIYVVQTYTKVIARCLLMTTDPGDLVLDPTCGSGTTAYVAEQWGRRWITIDTSRVAIALARTRLMAAKFPYYLLTDSPEGIRKEMESSGSARASRAAVDASSTASASADKSKVSDEGVGHDTRGRVCSPENDIKRGFVFKRVPHVTLKSIANNPDIKEGMSREQIDAAIAKHADTELLYDQPYEDNKRIRVTGPFTVESLSPHRTLSAEIGSIGLRACDEKNGGTGVPACDSKTKKTQAGTPMLPTPKTQAGTPVPPTIPPSGDAYEGASGFVNLIIENLKSAGVQNTRKGERLKFDRLETFANPVIHAKGEYTENGKVKTVGVFIGPEHGTVGPDDVKEAAKEAVKGQGVDLLVVCGFAFDPHVTEEAKNYGKLTILITRMNPDLAMGDELLKKTGAGNLFMVFGEVDLEVRRVPSSSGGTRSVASDAPTRSRRSVTLQDKEEWLVVEVKGLDVYDPTTGQIRNSKNTDDIACWFIDTDYNGESFFVRQAYFTGADEPYEKLKRALRAEIDESAWQSLYSTTSRPFPAPKTKKIAVKVINHYGDEVLKVWEVK